MKHEKNWLEWTVFSVSALLVALVIGQLAYDAVTTGDEPPRLTVITGEARNINGHFAVPVTVQNDGDTTAEAVRIEVTNGQESSQFEIDYLPRHSRRQGWVTFTHPPEGLKTRVLGFKTP